MQCDFLIPSLFSAPTSYAIKDSAPTLAALLARGTLVTENADSTEAWLARRFGIESASSFAAIAWIGEQQGNLGANHVLRADPVHLSVNRDRVVLLDASQLEISPDEADALCKSLQAHFAGDGLDFNVTHPERWYIRSENPILLHTHPVSAVRGRNVASYWFEGADRAIWQNRLSEMQMLLHAHPVNEAREEAGRLPINGVWFWGAGVKRNDLTQTYGHIIAHDPLLAGFALLTRAKYFDTAAFHADFLPLAPLNRTLIVLSELDSFAAYGEWDAWREALAALDKAWFKPTRTALRNGALSALTINAPDKNRGAKITTTRYDLLKFWRREFIVEPCPR